MDRGLGAVALKPRLYYGWVLATALGVTTIVSYGTTQYLMGVLIVPIGSDLHWSRTQIAGAFSAGLVVAAVLGIPAGRLVDRRGARVLLSAGSVLAAACLVLLSRMTEIWQLYVLWSGGLGLAMAMTLYPVTLVVVANWFERRRGSALALVTLLGGLSSPIYIPAAGLLVSIGGWRQALLWLAASQLVVSLPLHATLVRRHPEDLGLQRDGVQGPTSTESRMAGLTPRQALRTPAFWLLALAGGAGMMASSALIAHQIAFLVSRRQDPVFAAAVGGAVGLASLPSRVLLNLLSHRLTPRLMLALSSGLQALGVVILELATSTAGLVAYVAVFGFGFGAVSPLRTAVSADLFGRRHLGAITSVQNLGIGLCAATGPLLAGAIFDLTGGYDPAIWMVAALFAAACAATLAVQPSAGL